MRFFKHFTDSHRGQSMLQLFDRLGHMGIACYWTLTEMCAEKLEERMDAKNGERLTESDCEFIFHKRILRQNLRLSQAKVELFLGECSTLALLSFRIDGQLVKILMPKLLKCLERLKKKDVKATSVLRQHDVLDKEEDQEEENINVPNETNVSLEQENTTPFGKGKKSKARISITTLEDIERAIPSEVRANLTELYPKDFTDREEVKILNWLAANPRKNSKTSAGWIKFLSGWLERSWISYQNSLPTNPSKKTAKAYSWGDHD